MLQLISDSSLSILKTNLQTSFQFCKIDTLSKIWILYMCIVSNIWHHHHQGDDVIIFRGGQFVEWSITRLKLPATCISQLYLLACQVMMCWCIEHVRSITNPKANADNVIDLLSAVSISKILHWFQFCGFHYRSCTICVINYLRKCKN